MHLARHLECHEQGRFFIVAVDINQKDMAFCMQAVGREMVSQVPESVKVAGKSEQCHGKIVNFTSISGRRGRSLQIHYASSKAAVISMTQSVALSFSPAIVLE